MKSGLIQGISTGINLNQSLREAIGLLQYSTHDLSLLVSRLLQQNPLLDVDETDIDPEDTGDDFPTLTAAVSDLSRRPVSDRIDDEMNLHAESQTLHSHLLAQCLHLGLDTESGEIAAWLVYSLDDRGWLSHPIDELIKCCEITQDRSKILSVLKMIQTLDPAGVGCQDLKECLLLQLERQKREKGNLPDTVYNTAKLIVSEQLDAFLHASKKRRVSLPDVSSQDLSDALVFICGLDTAPGLRFASGEPGLLDEPELHLHQTVDQAWVVVLRDSLMTRLRVNHDYELIISKNKKYEQYQTIKGELISAKNIIYGLKKRNNTLVRVAQYLVDQQKDFLRYGIGAMKPLTLAQTAESLKVHESTVSRITTGKYIETPHGVFELKNFFSGALSLSTQESAQKISTASIKDMIKNIIINNKVGHAGAISDTQIMMALNKQGIQIARRTVAKYRNGLGLNNVYKRGPVCPEKAFKLSVGQPKKKVYDSE